MKCEDIFHGVKLISPKIFNDERGFFLESYQKKNFFEEGIEEEFVQDNYSYSEKNVLRGMHFQSYPGQSKLISVIEGEIFDVVVDLRPGSPTFKKWKGIALSRENLRQLYIPKGFAHGFCVIGEKAFVHYKVSSPYVPQTEKGFHYLDPEVGIDWPIKNPTVSEKDRTALSLSEVLYEKSMGARK